MRIDIQMYLVFETIFMQELSQLYVYFNLNFLPILLHNYTFTWPVPFCNSAFLHDKITFQLKEFYITKSRNPW